MSRKIYVTVILMLFLLPLVSWYYLQSGLSWRKQAQIIMSGTTPFPQGKWTDDYGKQFETGQLAEHVSIVTVFNCENEDSTRSTIQAIYKQFKATEKANVIILNRCASSSPDRSDSLKTGFYFFGCQDDSVTLCKLLVSDFPAGKNFALIDRNKVIRSYYAANTKDEKRLLLEHMALLLPRERSDQIELKRGSKE